MRTFGNRREVSSRSPRWARVQNFAERRLRLLPQGHSSGCPLLCCGQLVVADMAVNTRGTYTTIPSVVPFSRKTVPRHVTEMSSRSRLSATVCSVLGGRVSCACMRLYNGRLPLLSTDSAIAVDKSLLMQQKNNRIQTVHVSCFRRPRAILECRLVGALGADSLETP